MDAPLSYVTSPDGKTWSKSNNITNGYSNYGHQMHVYRGELYGVMVQNRGYEKQLFATKYQVGSGWKSWRSLPEKFLSQGRASVATLNDRFYVVRRGTNNAVYLAYTSDFDNWVDVGRIGSSYAKTMAAPAIAAYDGLLYLAGVGEDKYIYWTIADADGKRLMSWKKIEGTGTQSALEMVVQDNLLYLLHTGYNNDKFFYQTLSGSGVDTGTRWSQPIPVATHGLHSGLSATSWKYNGLVVTYKAASGEAIKYKIFDGKNWSSENTVPNVEMAYQTGLSTWGGQLFVSYASRAPVNRYAAPDGMSEKGGFVHEEEVDDWDCKWQNPEDKKSLVRRMLCM